MHAKCACRLRQSSMKLDEGATPTRRESQKPSARRRRARLRIRSACVGASCITAAAGGSVCEHAGVQGARRAPPPLRFTAVCHRRRLTAARRGFVPRCASSAPEGARRDARERAVLSRSSPRSACAPASCLSGSHTPRSAFATAAPCCSRRHPWQPAAFRRTCWERRRGSIWRAPAAEPAASSCGSWRAHQRCTALPTTADRRPECCGGGAWREQHSDRHS